MRKQQRVGIYLDYLHKGFVCTCIAVTLYASSYLMMRGYNYVANVRPEIQKFKEAEKRKLLAEGAPDNLDDTAPVLKM